MGASYSLLFGVAALFSMGAIITMVFLLVSRVRSESRPHASRPGLAIAFALGMAIVGLLVWKGPQVIRALRSRGAPPQDVPFTTSCVERARGGGSVLEATWRTHSSAGYGILDIGDVRIAVEDWAFEGETRGSLPIRVTATSPPASLTRTGATTVLGQGRNTLTTIWSGESADATVRFANFEFTIASTTLVISGVRIPLGGGHHLVRVTSDGEVISSGLIP